MRRFRRRLRRNLVSPETIIQHGREYDLMTFTRAYQRRKSDVYFSILDQNPNVVLPARNCHFITMKVLQLFIKGHIHMPVGKVLEPASFWATTSMTRHTMMLLFKASEVDDSNHFNRDLDERVFTRPANRSWLCLYLDEMTGGSADGLKDKDKRKFLLEPFSEAVDSKFLLGYKTKGPLTLKLLNRFSLLYQNYKRVVELNQALETLLESSPMVGVILRRAGDIAKRIELEPKKLLVSKLIMDGINEIIQSLNQFAESNPDTDSIAQTCVRPDSI